MSGVGTSCVYLKADQRVPEAYVKACQLSLSLSPHCPNSSAWDRERSCLCPQAVLWQYYWSRLYLWVLVLQRSKLSGLLKLMSESHLQLWLQTCQQMSVQCRSNFCYGERKSSWEMLCNYLTVWLEFYFKNSYKASRDFQEQHCSAAKCSCCFVAWATLTENVLQSHCS